MINPGPIVFSPLFLRSALRGELVWLQPGTPCIYTLLDASWLGHPTQELDWTWDGGRHHEAIAPSSRCIVLGKDILQTGDGGVRVVASPPYIPLSGEEQARYLVCLQGKPTYTRSSYPIFFYIDLDFNLDPGVNATLEGHFLTEPPLTDGLAIFEVK
jgi:hypothetical protein